MPDQPDPAAPRHEILVALRVTDDAEYARYRDAMRPILHAHGGHFRADWRVEHTLAGTPRAANRVFVLSFPDEPTRHAFFANPDYTAARAAHFEPSVAEAEIIAAWTT